MNNMHLRCLCRKLLIKGIQATKQIIQLTQLVAHRLLKLQLFSHPRLDGLHGIHHETCLLIRLGGAVVASFTAYQESASTREFYSSR